MSPSADPTSAGPDWTVQAADTIEAVVSVARDKATVPVRTAARALVYGLALAVVGIVALILTVVGLVRLATVYLPVAWVGWAPGHHHRVWVAYVAVGVILTLFGLFFLRKAENAAQERP
jgi:hypothetical protein